jgi:predicted metal-binding membrane protein
MLMSTSNKHARARCGLADLVTHDSVFVAFCGVLFLGAASGTVTLSQSMDAGHGWMMWMRSTGQTWMAAGGMFLGMWMVMMAAMMLPSLTLVLLRYREASAAAGDTRITRSTALMGIGYFTVWAVLGIVAYPLGAATATVAGQLSLGPRAGSMAIGVLVLIGGVLQLTQWNAHHVACCRELAVQRTWRSNGVTPWKQGLTLGVHCACCSALPMAILLMPGVMSLSTMSIVTVAITVERVAPRSARVARALGVAANLRSHPLLSRTTTIHPRADSERS